MHLQEVSRLYVEMCINWNSNEPDLDNQVLWIAEGRISEGPKCIILISIMYYQECKESTKPVREHELQLLHVCLHMVKHHPGLTAVCAHLHIS